MKKIIKPLLGALVITLMFTLSGCPETDSIDHDSNSIVSQFTSGESGYLSTNGYEIIIPVGVIRKKDDGTDGVVSISIERDINTSDLPVPIPSNYSLVNKVANFGPAGFIFTYPVQIFLPAGDAATPEGLLVIWYNDRTQSWQPIPINDIDETNKRLGISAFELGYFAVVRDLSYSIQSKEAEIQQNKRVGGIRYSHAHTPGYSYSLTVRSVAYRFPEVGWPNLIGWNVSTGSRIGGGARDITHMGNIPQGTYTIVVSRQRQGTFSQSPGPRETYTNPILIEVGPFSSIGGWSVENFSGWSDLSLSGGTWSQGNPDEWPQPTTPYGTGEFQATLLWSNISGSSTDLDLHLFGPNNIHVYFSNKRSADNSIELDRDWMRGIGSAIENIYSIASMPKGDYQVYVNPYSGDVPKTFEVRVIRQGSLVRTFRGTATATKGSTTDRNQMIHVSNFKIN